jgi:hypothetical protein
MLAIQEYLSSFESIEQGNSFLDKKCNICATKERHSFLNEYLFLYKSRTGFADSILNREATGLILNTKREVVCRTPLFPLYIKSWSDPRITYGTKSFAYEIEDGTPVMVFNYKNDWHISTPDSIDGTILLDQGDHKSSPRYEVIFLMNKLFGRWQEVFKSENDPNKCYYFELVGTGVDRIRKYNRKELILVSIIDKVSGEEELNSVLDFNDTYGLSNPDFLLVDNRVHAENFHKFSHIYSKGTVLVDEKGERFQQNSRLYSALRIALMVGRLDPGGVSAQLVNVARECKDSKSLETVKEDFPQYKEALEGISKAKQALSFEITKAYTADKSEFLKRIQEKTPELDVLRPGLVKFITGSISSREGVINSISSHQLLKYVGHKFPELTTKSFWRP